MKALADLAARQTAKLGTERAANRLQFPAAAELIDMIRAGGLDGRIVYATNDEGETWGARDPGPWIDMALVAKARELPEVMKRKGKA